ncbi:metal ABC transporter solute-binding protein, Zn/Mn family [Tichowtungia aerotolerans]|uniref:Zinc ABC transporter solute-binding protein n=1 Tax=Tichowtungia aerotolerans TaxID=2697043 RepID=A0A6P1M6X9_9BACT|nr:zinc ABC transporter substrate-binding protein [Tichowtungia aerotolerans]QHI68344.1 zinc ABC transporter solute-binding protein [Tichowtungia aerotolerans]
MKKNLFTVIVGISLSAQAAELNVWCGIPPLVSVVRSVGGERVEVGSLMDDRQDPHTWSPTPKAVAGVRDADLFFVVGLPYEQTVSQKLTGMNSGLRVVNAAAELDAASDPHIWLSLSNLSAMADVVERSLAQTDPAGAEIYRQNCAAYQQTLTEKDAQLKQKLNPLQGRTFYVYHPVFGYFSQEYGLKQGVVELDGKSPSPKDLLGLVNRAREEQVRVVFVQPQFSSRPAQIIADRIGGTVVPLNPLQEDPVAVIEEAATALEETYANRP